MKDLQNGTQKLFLTNGKYYGINYTDDVVGFIVLVPVEDPEYGKVLELETGIFDKYSNSKIASMALDMIIKQFSNNRIDAIISGSNKNKERVRSLLKQKGFRKVFEGDDELWLCF